MDNFFKQFKDNLDNQPEPVFEEHDWLSLKRKLTDKSDKRPLSSLLLWLLAPLFLMSLGTNGFQYNQLKNTQQKMTLLENRFDSVSHNTVVFQSDTIFKIKTIYERDTVFKTKILHETEIVYVPFYKDSLNMVTLLKNSSDDFKTSDELKQPYPKEALNTFAFLKNSSGDLKSPDELKLHEVLSNKTLNFKTLENLKTLQPPLLKLKKPNDLLNLDLKPIVLIPKKTWKERLESLRPKDFSGGISAGLAYPMSDISSKPSGYAFGLQGAVSFSPNLSLWADAHYMQLSYKTDRMNDAIGIPVIPPPSNDFSFNLVTVSQPSLQYMAGLRYHFDSKKRLQPYLGLGYGAVTLLPYEVDYEFKNGSLGTVWEITQKINKQVTQWGFLLFDVGFEKRIAQHYRWQIGANYRLKLSNSAQSYRLFGLKTGIFYDF